MKDLAKSFINTSLLMAAQALPRRAMGHMMSVLRKNPEVADSWGYHIRPIHYYEPLPDFRSVQASQLRRRRQFPSIDFGLKRQLRLIEELGAKCRDELAALALSSGVDGFDFCNSYFPGFDACAYYALIRHLKPRRVIEVGSGYSTQIASHALRMNLAAGAEGELVCIEPYPEQRLMESGARFTLVKKRVQDVDPSFFSGLRENDVLFVDSSHVACAGSDVCAELLEILPSLPSGVWVHVHDIFFPDDYPASWLIERRIAWNEQYMLEAFLSYNATFSVELANHWLWLEHHDAVEALCPLAALVPEANRTAGASFWMRKKF